jgi:hypothetical protein
MAKQETYEAAKKRLFAEFAAMGFRVKDYLIVEQVELPCGEVLLFKKRAVHTKSNGLSTWLDIRGMPATTLKHRTEKARSLT